MRIANLVAAGLMSVALAACSSDNEDAAANGYGNGAGGPGGNGSGSGIESSDLGAGGAGNGGPLSQAQLQAATSELNQQVGAVILFKYDSSDISPEASEILRRQAAYMQKYPNLSFNIEGHCDERGTREYNLALGERRASSAKNALVALGIPAQRLQTVSYGKERPVAVGSSEAAQARNRRAVTVIQ